MARAHRCTSFGARPIAVSPCGTPCTSGVTARRLRSAGRFTRPGSGQADIFLWHQGEQDAILGTSSASYQAQFVAMTDALEASGYLKPTAPRIVGGLCSHDDTMLQELAAANPLVSYAGKPDPAANQGDDVHFTGQALAYFGTELYWRQYAAHVGPRVLAGRLDSPL